MRIILILIVGFWLQGCVLMPYPLPLKSEFTGASDKALVALSIKGVNSTDQFGMTWQKYDEATGEQSLFEFKKVNTYLKSGKTFIVFELPAGEYFISNAMAGYKTIIRQYQYGYNNHYIGRMDETYTISVENGKAYFVGDFTTYWADPPPKRIYLDVKEAQEYLDASYPNVSVLLEKYRPRNAVFDCGDKLVLFPNQCKLRL